MAIARGAGTEIIRSNMFEDIANTQQKLIVGVQHHIYTVLSVIIRCAARSGSEGAFLKMVGYDSTGGTTDSSIFIARILMASAETYVFNDKFSFNGYEPSNFSGPMDDATKQDAIADQGSSVSQSLVLYSDGGSTQYDAIVSFIDQNNA